MQILLSASCITGLGCSQSRMMYASYPAFSLRYCAAMVGPLPRTKPPFHPMSGPCVPSGVSVRA